MKLLLISDTHGMEEELFQLFDDYSKEVDLIIHCGDSELPNDAFAAYQDLKIVRGNCDYEPHFKDEICFKQNEIKFFVTHGHLFNVKASAVNLSYRAEELGVNVAFFGHTHKALSFQENKIIYVNPGSFRLPNYRPERSFVILEVVGQRLTVNFFDHLKNEISDLKQTYQIV